MTGLCPAARDNAAGSEYDELKADACQPRCPGHRSRRSKLISLPPSLPQVGARNQRAHTTEGRPGRRSNRSGLLSVVGRSARAGLAKRAPPVPGSGRTSQRARPPGAVAARAVTKGPGRLLLLTGAHLISKSSLVSLVIPSHFSIEWETRHVFFLIKECKLLGRQVLELDIWLITKS